MSGSVAQAAQLLAEVLDRVDGLTVHTDPSAAVVTMPAAVVGPPALFWEAYSLSPTRAEFPVHLIESTDELTMERVWDLIPTVSEALDEEANATVLRAVPSQWAAAEADRLPSYVLTVEVRI
jgi:hypothetical protein